MLVYILCVAASPDWLLYANGLGSPLYMVHGPYTDHVQGVTLCGRRSVGCLPDGPYNEGNEWIQLGDNRSWETEWSCCGRLASSQSAGICQLYNRCHPQRP
jgi:hypothetical protein